MPLRRVKSDANVVPPVTRRKCARNAASTCGKCADCTRSSQERQSSGPATDSGTPRRILRSLRNQRGRSCKFTTNPVFCATGRSMPMARPTALGAPNPAGGFARQRQSPRSPAGPSVGARRSGIGVCCKFTTFQVSCLAEPDSAYMAPH